jgi:hypothetical protein
VYLFSDHLGSTSLSYRPSDGQTSRQLYKPWGENRWNSGTVPTTFRFTGQRQEASLGGPSGLYDYGARFYDPYQYKGGDRKVVDDVSCLFEGGK